MTPLDKFKAIADHIRTEGEFQNRDSAGRMDNWAADTYRLDGLNLHITDGGYGNQVNSQAMAAYVTWNDSAEVKFMRGEQTDLDQLYSQLFG